MDSSEYPAEVGDVGDFYCRDLKARTTQSRDMQLLVASTDNPEASLNSVLVSGGAGFGGTEVDFGEGASSWLLSSMRTYQNASSEGEIAFSIYDDSGQSLEVLKLTKSGVEIAGDVTIKDGATQTINVDTIKTDDLNITLGASTSTLDGLTGIGILSGDDSVADAPSFVYESDAANSVSRWVSNVEISVPSIDITGAASTGDISGGEITATTSMQTPFLYFTSGTYKLSGDGISGEYDPDEGTDVSTNNLTFDAANTRWDTTTMRAQTLLAGATPGATLTDDKLDFGDYTYTSSGIRFSDANTISYSSADMCWNVDATLEVGAGCRISSTQFLIGDSSMESGGLQVGGDVSMSSTAFTASSVTLSSTGLHHADATYAGDIQPKTAADGWEVTGAVQFNNDTTQVVGTSVTSDTFATTSSTYGMDTSAGFTAGNHAFTSANGLQVSNAENTGTAVQISSSGVTAGDYTWSTDGLSAGPYGFSTATGWVSSEVVGGEGGDTVESKLDSTGVSLTSTDDAQLATSELLLTHDALTLNAYTYSPDETTTTTVAAAKITTPSLEIGELLYSDSTNTINVGTSGFLVKDATAAVVTTISATKLETSSLFGVGTDDTNYDLQVDPTTGNVSVGTGKTVDIGSSEGVLSTLNVYGALNSYNDYINVDASSLLKLDGSAYISFPATVDAEGVPTSHNLLIDSSEITIGTASEVVISDQGLTIGTDSADGIVIQKDMLNLEGLEIKRVASSSDSYIIKDLEGGVDAEVDLDEDGSNTDYAVVQLPDKGILLMGETWRIVVNTGGALTFQKYDTETWTTKLILE